MTIRLLICDIDGTLVKPDKSLSDDVVAGVKRALDAGLKVSLISARPPSGMLWIARRLGLTGAVGAFNGGTIVQADGTIVAAEHIGPAAAARALELIDVDGVTPWLFADGDWYARTDRGEHVDHERLAANVEPVVRDDFAALTARADKIVAVCDDHALLAALDPKVAAALGSAATVARSQPYYLDVTALHADKGAGVGALARSFGVALADVAVIGDQNNDLPMFAVAGFSIAMGQAADNVRDAADAVTTSNQEDGVAHAIDTIVLPKVREA